MTHKDLIIIGAGPGGYELAAKAAARGLAVTLIERGELGGTCLNRGCIPTKALLRSAEVAAIARHASEYGVGVGAVTPDWTAALARKDAIVAELRAGVESLLARVDIVRASATFVDAGTVEAAGERYAAPRIVIATGSRPARLDIPGADRAITSDELLSLPALPASVAIIGGGVIGMESAVILSEFGVKVTVIEYCKEILPPFDREIAKRLRTLLTRRGIDIIVDAAVTAIAPGSVSYERRGKALAVEADMAVMATGRRPVIPDGAAEAGIEIGRRGIAVDPATMATTAPGVYAIGDVNGLCMLAHAASAQGDIVIGERRDLGVIPSALFTIPECAMVGLTEDQCLEQGRSILVGKSTFRANGKALALGETDGLVKLIVDADTRLILGCHIMGPHASDLIQAVADIMVARATVDTLRAAVHTHPTLSEALLAAVAAT